MTSRGNVVDGAANRAVRGGVVSGMSVLLGLLMGICVPLVALRLWSGGEFGLWVAAIGWMSLWSLTDYSHQTFVGNAYTVALFRGTSAPSDFINPALWTAGAIGAGKLALLALVIGMAPGLQSLVVAAPLIIAQALASGFMGILMQLFRPHGSYATGVLLSLGSQVLSTFVALLAIALMKVGPFGAATAFAVTKLVTELAVVVFSLKRFEIVVTAPGRAEWKTGWQNLRRSMGYVLNTAMESGVTHGSVVLLERIAGGLEAGYFATVRTLSNVVLQNVNLVLLPISHDLVRLAEARDRDGFRAVVGGVSLVLAIAISVFAAGLLLFGEAIFQLWTKGRFGPLGAVVPCLAGAAFLRAASVPAYVFFQQFNRTEVLNVASALRVVGFLVPILIGEPSAAIFAVAAISGEFASAACLLIRWHGDPLARAAGGSVALLVPATATAILGSVVLVSQMPEVWGVGLVLGGSAVSVLWSFGSLGLSSRHRLIANLRRLVPNLLGVGVR